jgi:hypothetical protein
MMEKDSVVKHQQPILPAVEWGGGMWVSVDKEDLDSVQSKSIISLIHCSSSCLKPFMG